MFASSITNDTMTTYNDILAAIMAMTEHERNTPLSIELDGNDYVTITSLEIIPAMTDGDTELHVMSLTTA